MKELKLRPDPDGIIEVYQPYWNIEKDEAEVAPPLTVYTDLMITGDPRNMDIAGEIYEKFLTHLTG